MTTFIYYKLGRARGFRYDGITVYHAALLSLLSCLLSFIRQILWNSFYITKNIDSFGLRAQLHLLGSRLLVKAGEGKKI